MTFTCSHVKTGSSIVVSEIDKLGRFFAESLGSMIVPQGNQVQEAAACVKILNK